MAQYSPWLNISPKKLGCNKGSLLASVRNIEEDLYSGVEISDVVFNEYYHYHKITMQERRSLKSEALITYLQVRVGIRT